MTLPTSDTRVAYASGVLSVTSTVLHVEPATDGRLAVITERTSFHPVDAAWPDQPADAGTMRVRGEAHVIRDAVVAATDGISLHLGDDIPVRKGTDGWAFLVAHLVDDEAGIQEGDEVEISADAARRRALSVGHTACHLAALALNAALADRWSKPARDDALGHPDFDGIAIESSLISPNGSVDRYRLNKSLRRAGFDTASLTEHPGSLDGVAETVGEHLDRWVRSGATVRIDRDGEGLTDRRYWVCELPQGTARIPCGGTHVESLADLGSIRVAFRVDDEGGTPVLEFVSTAHPRH